MAGSVGARRARYLEAMGITRWVRRASHEEAASSPAISRGAQAAPTLDAEDWGGATSVDAERAAPAAMDWQTLERAVAACTQCRLHAGRTQTVFGVGARNASWLFIGEAPGAEEDRQGEPFVGRAGQLLNAMLFAVGLKREEVFIANVLKCLRYNALVQLGDGSWERIGRLVRSRYSGQVMSVNAAGRLVPRPVTGWHETPLGNRRVFRLSYRNAKNAGRSRSCIQLTGDHPVLTKRGFVPVESLQPRDQIATGQGLSSLAFDVVCGTVLGDGHIAPDRTMLSFSHSGRYRDYALFKAELLSELRPVVDTLSVRAVANGERYYPAVQVRTRAHRALRVLRQAFYAPKKHVPTWIAERFNARMLAFWFMDDGYTRIRAGRQPLAEIATCGFGENDLAILVKALAGLGLTAKALRGRIYFGAFETRALSERIAAFVPPVMRYKLHPEVAQRIPFSRECFQLEPANVLYDEVEIEDITHEKRVDKTFFCIDVEETHNFVTAGGVVHNCRPPGNRDPQPDEVAHCEPYLVRQIELINPRLIVALGRHAAHSLLKTELPLGKLRGQRLSYHGTPLIVTYHPAYLLRNLADKRKAWSDLLLAKRIVGAK